MRRLLLTSLALWLAAGMWGVQAQSAPSHVKTDQVEAHLLVHAPEGIASGRVFWMGLQLQHAPDWHTYWKNPGDSGLPTTLHWQLPEGLQAGDVAWPTPQKFPLGDLANHGYSGQVVLPVPVRVGPGYTGGDVRIRLEASWLACRTECIPEEGRFELVLAATTKRTEHQALFEKAWASAPTPNPPGTQARLVPGPEHLTVELDGLPKGWRGQTLEVFPETPNLTAPGGKWTQKWTGTRWSAQLPYNEQRTDSPDNTTLVVATVDRGGAPTAGVRLDAAATGAWPPVAMRTAVPEALARALEAAPPPAPPTTLAWLLALGGALLGGLLLNLMPCVFPVLAIKVLAFAQQPSGAQATAHRWHGVAYTAGVLLSFLALGAALLGLRTTGEQLGWGFQLQNPAVVAGLAVLFTLIGLNLAGLFALGQVLPQRLVTLRAQHAGMDAFLTGVLATAVASPCTAPFMGASLGLAIGFPAAQAMGVFGALGLGMALPYLLASWVPGLARLVPHPGPWMERLKQWLAFPMLVTVVWLVWVLGQQTGVDGAALLLLWLVGLGWLLWSLGLSGRARWVMGGVAGGALLWLALTWGGQVLTPSNATQVNPTATSGVSPAGAWEPWSAEKQARALAQGRVVFVDYTAAWCMTCQYNKRTTLADTGLLEALAQRQVVLMRADWTRRDAEVSAALQALGRNGVPVYAFYRAGQAPLLLPELPSRQDVQNALERL
jgi:thiol:disulfide interchange protein DsbD